ncbi:hypothetical protein M407DRAFT_17509, partial [Tulasnella calospora MUT 4182]
MSTTKSTPSPPSNGWRIPPSICRLPLELISYIIALSLPEAWQTGKRLKALYATRTVSNTWRDAIDSTPSLWCAVGDGVPFHVNSTSIQRSGSYPLDVYIARRSPESRLAMKQDPIELIELVAREIRRWSTVTLRLPSPEVCSSYLTSPAPRLRNLTVIWKHWDGYTTTVNLFGGIAPRLETLKVERVPIDWNSSFIHGLRELELSDMIDEQISTQQVLDILASAPLLNRLGICNSFVEDDPQPFQIRPPIIQLPNMNTIHFEYLELKAVEIILSSI